MAKTRRQMLQAATASVGLVSMPAVMTRAFAAESLPLRGREKYCPIQISRCCEEPRLISSAFDRIGRAACGSSSTTSSLRAGTDRSF